MYWQKLTPEEMGAVTEKYSGQDCLPPSQTPGSLPEIPLPAANINNVDICAFGDGAVFATVRIKPFNDSVHYVLKGGGGIDKKWIIGGLIAGALVIGGAIYLANR